MDVKAFQSLSVYCFLIQAIAFLWHPDGFGKEVGYIPIGAAKTRQAVLAMPVFQTQTRLEYALAQQVSDGIIHDLTFMDSFRFLDRLPVQQNLPHPQKKGSPATQEWDDWKNQGADFLLKGKLTLSSRDVLAFEMVVYDLSLSKKILAKKYVVPKIKAPLAADASAEDIVQIITGRPGLFASTQIAMCCKANRGVHKEIYTMNFDGTHLQQITHHRSIAFAPAWSSDRKKIAYSLFNRHKNNVRNIDLFEIDLATRKVTLLSAQPGMNSGAAYSPDPEIMALTLSVSGTPSIYQLNRRTQSLKRITYSFALDVDPAWSRDGKKMAFVSSRTGNPMIFKMNADGTEQKRLTFAGQLNATPSWFPNGLWIAFAGWLDHHFDLFTIAVDGSRIDRLTRNQGSNEDPDVSPDGHWIAFSSNRTGKKNIYLTNITGSIVNRLTHSELGDCTAPKWSPLIRNSQVGVQDLLNL